MQPKVRGVYALSAIQRRADTTGKRNKRGNGRVKGDTRTRSKVKHDLRSV